MEDSGAAEERGGPSPQDVLWAMHQFVVASAALDVTLARRLSLGPSEYQAMKHLMTADRPLGPVELGSLVGLTSGSATSLVDRLERAGHLHRRRDRQDRRRVTLEPTTTAVSSAEQQLQPLENVLKAVLEEYSPKEREVILRFLSEAVSSYQDFEDEAPQS